MASSSSASLAEAERTIERLEKENSRQRNELHETKSLYAQLVQESERESFDERRVLLLKSQVIQLERQLLLMSEALSSRSTVQLEMEIALLDIADRCRKYIGIDNKSPNVSLPRAELMKQVEQAESVRLKLSRTIENNSKDNLSKPLLLMNGFVKSGDEDSYTLMDVCSGKLDHMNLKHVSKLENELSELYHQLVTVEQALAKSLIGRHHNAQSHISTAELESRYLSTQKAVDKIQSCCEKLFELNVLIPSAPLPAFKSKLKDVTLEKVLSSLPTTVKNKQDTKQIIDSLMKSVNYQLQMKNLEIKALKDELKFHQSMYEKQCQYMDELFHAMRIGYGQFQSDANELIVSPMDDVFSKYEVLKCDATEDALREFLTTFKDNADGLHSAVEKLRFRSDDCQGDVLSEFGEKFFADLLTSQDDCAKKRDKFLDELDVVKRLRDENAEQLDVLLRPMTKEVNQAKLAYDRIIASNNDDDDDIVVGKARVNTKPPPKRSSTSKLPNNGFPASHECLGCAEDETKTSAKGLKELRRHSTPNTPDSALDESSGSIPDSRVRTPVDRTPITGSSIPRTPSSNLPSRRRSTTDANRKSSLPQASGLPSRNLKLKK